MCGPGPGNDNPSLEEIEKRQEAERAKEAAEKAAAEAHAKCEQARQQAEEEREQARKRQEEADRAAAQAAEEAQRMKAQMEEAAAAAKHAEELAREASMAAKEEAQRLAQEAQAERERSQKISEEADRAMAEMKMEANRAQKNADEQRRLAEEAKALAEERERTAAEEMKKAKEAMEDAERRLKDGIQPIVTPTPEEVAVAKQRIQYKKELFHFAVAGISGSGKSSLVNAFRGLRGRVKGAAAVGTSETTLQMTRYEDANPFIPVVWYDVPGAGTIKCSDWQYFNDQGLYVFDGIIVLFDNRFTMTDIAILMNARRFNIPTYIVRSKADQHIRNTMMEMEYNSEGDDEEDIKCSDELYKEARKQFIDDTRKSVKTNLEDVNLPDQRVYIVSNITLIDIVKRKVPKKAIDELELINDLINESCQRRKVTMLPLNVHGLCKLF